MKISDLYNEEVPLKKLYAVTHILCTILSLTWSQFIFELFFFYQGVLYYPNLGKIEYIYFVHVET